MNCGRPVILSVQPQSWWHSSNHCGPAIHAVDVWIIVLMQWRMAESKQMILHPIHVHSHRILVRAQKNLGCSWYWMYLNHALSFWIHQLWLTNRFLSSFSIYLHWKELFYVFWLLILPLNTHITLSNDSVPMKNVSCIANILDISTKPTLLCPPYTPPSSQPNFITIISAGNVISLGLFVLYSDNAHTREWVSFNISVSEEKTQVGKLTPKGGDKKFAWW